MAKQLGLHKVQGKVGEHSYYESKNGGSLMRSINQGLSERVKSSKEYANTRLNNAEFGGAGSCAGAIVRGITSRWRFILNSKATGLLAKAIKAGMLLDTTSPWGKRLLSVTAAGIVQDRFNMLSKNQLPEYIKDYVDNHFKYDPVAEKVFTDSSLDLDNDHAIELQGMGVDALIVLTYAYEADTPTPDQNTIKYVPCSSNIKQLSDFSSNVVISTSSATTMFPMDTSPSTIVPQNSVEKLGGVLVIILPVKLIGENPYILQEHCSAYWKTVGTGTAPEP